MNKRTAILILIAVGLITHFAYFGHPDQTVFDEVHFGKFVSAYYTHEYYFDIHPPLGKLMVAGFAKIFNFEPKYSFINIGERFPDNMYMVLRFLPSLAGALLPLVIYLLALELKFSHKAALTTGLLIALENALLSQTRFILMDGFLLLFGFLSLLFYFKSRSKSLNTKYLILASIFGGLAISIKWTGLTFLALPLLIELWGCFKKFSLKVIIEQVTFFIAIPCLIYFSIFALHFSLLTKAGSGDAFMRQGFQSENLTAKFVQLNFEMYESNKRLGATHSYGSPWYSWPFMARPIYYWNFLSPQGEEKIYSIGNPVIWWASTVAVILLLLRNSKFIILNFKSILKLKIENLNLQTEQILLLGFALNLLPFIGIQRVMFLYHYLTALIFAILILVYLIDQTDNAKAFFSRLVFAAVVAFIFFAPLTYGLPLSPQAFETRIWLESWR